MQEKTPKTARVSANEWRSIKKLASDVANAMARDNIKGANEARLNLLKALSFLEKKYGRIPSLLATKADYIEDDKKRISLLHAAYKLARRNADKLNIVLICSSLADFHITEAFDKKMEKNGCSVSKKFLLKIRIPRKVRY
jgi:hypothetical protein